MSSLRKNLNVSTTKAINEARNWRNEILDKSHPTRNLEREAAQERIHHDYEPLLGHRTIPVCDSEESCHYEKIRGIEVLISYVCFFILGAAVLLGWNAVLLSTIYFKARTEGARFESSLGSCISLSFTGANLAFLGLANSTQSTCSLSRRVGGSLLVLFMGISIFILSTYFPIIEPNLSFFSLIFITIMMGGAAAFLQNATVALSSRFGPMHLQGILSGQGAIGLSVAILQFSSSYYSSLEPKLPRPSNFAIIPVPQEVLNSAFDFFISIQMFTIVSFLCHVILIQLPYYKLIIKGNQKSTVSTKPIESIGAVQKKIRFYSFFIFYIFLITLSVFPAITARVLSVEKEDGFLGKLSKPELFIPLHFIVFNAGDWIGRALLQVPVMVIKHKTTLAILSLGRTAFIPLFLMCHIVPNKISIISSDLTFMLLLGTFALSNGYLSTSILLSAIQDPILEQEEIDRAATYLSLMLTFGLAVGSLMSFPLSWFV